MAYSLPFAAASPRPSRAVGIGLFLVQIPSGPLVGSYSSTVARKPFALCPPTAYSLPFGATATPSFMRLVGIWAFGVQVSVAGSYSSTTAQCPSGGQNVVELAPPTA